MLQTIRWDLKAKLIKFDMYKKDFRKENPKQGYIKNFFDC